MGNTKFAGTAGTTQLKHNTLVKHSDLYSNENAMLLSDAFGRQKAVNQCTEETELILKYNTAFLIEENIILPQNCLVHTWCSS